VVDPAPVDPVGELQEVAARLSAVHRVEPQNVPVARELRLTLVELARIEPVGFDPLDELRRIVDGAP